MLPCLALYYVLRVLAVGWVFCCGALLCVKFNLDSGPFQVLLGWRCAGLFIIAVVEQCLGLWHIRL